VFAPDCVPSPVPAPNGVCCARFRPPPTLLGVNMKLKAFLLGTAAAFAAAPALAADLLTAEPVEFVRICDTFGTGYWFIPGTETCLKIGGYVRFDTRYRDDPIYSNSSSHSSNWDFRTRARLEVTASSNTDLGTLTGFLRFQGNFDPSSSTNAMVLVDKAYLSIGPLLAGLQTSAFDYPSGGYNLDLAAIRSDIVNQHVALSFKEGNTGIVFSLEDPRQRNGILANNGKWPDVVAAVTYADGPFDARLSGAIVDQFMGGAGYAVQLAATMKLDQIAKGDGVRFIAGYAQDAGSFTGANPTGGSSGLGAPYNGGTSWNVVGSAQHYWASNFSTAIMGSYVSATNVTSAYMYNAALSATYSPVKNFSVGAELAYTYKSNSPANPDTIVGLLRLQRDIQ
jgi:hypothetical protein